MKGSIRRKRSGRKGSFLPLLLIVVLFAGGLGYGVTKWVVLPSFNSSVPSGDVSVTEDVPKDPAEEAPSAAVIPQTVAPSAIPDEGTVRSVYAIQFGSYSSYEGAQEAAVLEAARGRTVRIVEKNGSYKIVSSPFDDRMEAERALAAISPEGEDGLFITTMEVLTQ